MNNPTSEHERLVNLEQKVENALALDARFKALEDSVKQLKPRAATLRDWIQTLGPYLSGLIILIVGFWLKDSVSQALEREKVDLSYVTNMRDLIAGFDKASEQPSADANAIALAMYGRFAMVPLIERLEAGDVAQIAAERGLRLIGANQPDAACPRFEHLLDDAARRFTWQTHKTIIRLMGASECVGSIDVLQAYAVNLDQAGADAAGLGSFAKRFSNPGAFDAESVDRLKQETSDALAILTLRKARDDSRGHRWWH